MKTYGTAKLEMHEGRRVWTIRAAPHVIVRLRRLFAAGGRGDVIRLSDTAENCRDLQWACARYPLEVDPTDVLVSKARRHREGQDAISRMLEAGYDPRRFELAIPARDYQRLAADLALKTRGLLLADDVGIGKTASAICTLTDPTTRPALVVTLTHLPRQWAAELARFAPSLRVHVIRNGPLYDLAAPPKSRRKGDAQTWMAVGAHDLPDVIVTSYSKLVKWRDALGPVVKSVFFDECQELRRRESDKYKAAKQIADGVDLRLGLSATPVYNYGGEIFAVLDCIAPGSLGTWKEFVESWCRTPQDTDERKAMVKNPRAFGMYAREQGLMLRRTRSEVGRELPAATRSVQHIDWDEAPIEAVEDRAEQLAKIILSAGDGTREGAFAKLRAAEELSWQLRQATGIAKAPYAADFIRLLLEAGEKSVLVFAWHREVYDILLERLKPFDVVCFTGEETTNQKEAAKVAFVEGRAPVMLMSLRAGAGIDGLQKVCRTAVFAELDWSPGVHDQCTGRIHRDGQKEPVMAYYLLADAGSDPMVADTLGVKRVQAESIRNPDLDVIAPLQVDPNHIRKLAEEFLARRGNLKLGEARAS